MGETSGAERTPARTGVPGRPRGGTGPEVPPGWLWRRPEMVAALARHDFATVYRALTVVCGMSQRGIAALTGQSQSEISEILAGRRVRSYDLLARLADRLGIPRGLLGLAYQGPPPAASGPTAATRKGPAPQPPIPRPGGVCPACSAQLAVTVWTGARVRALRAAKRMSVREFAAYLGVSDRMVSKWECGDGSIVPRPVNQAALDTVLTRADPDTRARFAATLTHPTPARAGGVDEGRARPPGPADGAGAGQTIKDGTGLDRTATDS